MAVAWAVRLVVAPEPHIENGHDVVEVVIEPVPAGFDECIQPGDVGRVFRPSPAIRVERAVQRQLGVREDRFGRRNAPPIGVYDRLPIVRAVRMEVGEVRPLDIHDDDRVGVRIDLWMCLLERSETADDVVLGFRQESGKVALEGAHLQEPVPGYRDHAVPNAVARTLASVNHVFWTAMCARIRPGGP